MATGAVLGEEIEQVVAATTDAVELVGCPWPPTPPLPAPAPPSIRARWGERDDRAPAADSS